MYELDFGLDLFFNLVCVCEFGIVFDVVSVVVKNLVGLVLEWRMCIL